MLGRMLREAVTSTEYECFNLTGKQHAPESLMKEYSRIFEVEKSHQRLAMFSRIRNAPYKSEGLRAMFRNLKTPSRFFRVLSSLRPVPDIDMSQWV